jgi:hypothetical protein
MENSSKIIVIEIELKRPAPVHNVVKTLLWASFKQDKRPVNMLHFFDENHYKAGNTLDFQLATRLPFFWPPKYGKKQCINYLPLLVSIPAVNSKISSPHSTISKLTNTICDKVGLSGML